MVKLKNTFLSFPPLTPSLSLVSDISGTCWRSLAPTCRLCHVNRHTSAAGWRCHHCTLFKLFNTSLGRRSIQVEFEFTSATSIAVSTSTVDMLTKPLPWLMPCSTPQLPNTSCQYIICTLLVHCAVQQFYFVLQFMPLKLTLITIFYWRPEQTVIQRYSMCNKLFFTM